jgi:hypothetical protein
VGLRDSAKKSLQSAPEAPNSSRYPSRNQSPESSWKPRESRRGLTSAEVAEAGKIRCSQPMKSNPRGLTTFLVHLLREGRLRGYQLVAASHSQVIRRIVAGLTRLSVPMIVGPLIALLVAERWHRRHLHEVLAGAVKRARAAVADRSTRGGKEAVGGVEAVNGVGYWRIDCVKMPR